MKILVKGEEISNYKIGKFNFFEKYFVPALFLIIPIIYSDNAFLFLDETYLNKFSEITKIIITCLSLSISSAILFVLYIKFYYENNRRNPSVTYFDDHLSVISDHNEGEVEVPFKMIKKFRFLGNYKVIADYKDEYVFKILTDDNNYWNYIVENPILDKENFIIPGPGSKIFPQDKKNKIFPLDRFSFKLKSNSKKNLAILDELNSKVNL